MAHRFSIRHIAKQRSSIGIYEYEILDNETVIARYQHDYRGDDAKIYFLDGIKRGWPFALATEVLVGGGPEPLELSTTAIAWLNDNVTD